VKEKTLFGKVVEVEVEVADGCVNCGGDDDGVVVERPSWSKVAYGICI
jgi:hypothetical protein